MWFSGLRGAMAYALSLQCVNIYSQDSVGKILLTLTLSIIVINVIKYDPIRFLYKEVCLSPS